MRHLLNSDGFMKPLLIIIVLLIAGYVSVEFGIPYYRYTSFRSEAKQIARLEVRDVEKIRAQLFEAAQDMKIPISAEDIIVTRKPHTTKVQTSWSTTVDIFGLYQKTLDFTVDLEE